MSSGASNGVTGGVAGIQSDPRQAGEGKDDRAMIPDRNDDPTSHRPQMALHVEPSVVWIEQVWRAEANLVVLQPIEF